MRRRHHGFGLHAAVRCAADDRQALEQLCRHITRPALANERAQTNATGQVALKQVVDECPVQRLLSCMMLSQWGIHPELACDGLAAVLLFGEQTFDLVSMDLNMPVMDGLTATARIRVLEHQQRRSKPIPVIAYTSAPIAGNQSAWSRSAITAALAKPCATAEMCGCITSQ